jgi:Plasmid encoded RepA protein
MAHDTSTSLLPFGQALQKRPAAPNTPKRPSRVQRRLIEAAASIAQNDENELCFQHTVFCQTGLPYRDPGDHVRQWQRTQGAAMLVIQAGQLLQPQRRAVIDVGLPWGAKPRLILAHLNAEAIKTGSPVIEAEDSLTAFVRRIRHFDGGREIRAFKNQLTRLSSALIRLAIARGDHIHQIDTKVITSFDLWFPKDEHQRVLWPSTIQLSAEYFDSLQAHAVPLREESVAALAHSAVALDIYAWLAQRLHRIKPEKPAFIPLGSAQRAVRPRL